MARETRVHSQVESYQRLKKWYLVLPCLTLSIIRLGSRVKWSNPGKGVASCPTPWCSSYWKGTLQVTLDYGRQIYLPRQPLSRVTQRQGGHSIVTILRYREGATPFPGLLHFTFDPYLIMMSVKQSGIKYNYLSLWYDLTWDWTLVFQTIGKHYTH